MKKSDLIPHGWMQEDLEEKSSEPIEEGFYTIINNYDDHGKLLKMNPHLRDLKKEEKQHMIVSKNKFWSEILKNLYFKEWGIKGSDLPEPPKKEYYEFLEYVVKNHIKKPKYISEENIYKWEYEKEFKDKFKFNLPKTIWDKIMEKYFTDFSEKNSKIKNIISKVKSKPPKKWFNLMLKEVMEKNTDYTAEQAAATVGNMWYNQIRPHKKTKIKKKFENKKSELVKKTIAKIAKNQLTTNIGLEVLPLLQEALKAEFQQWDLYYAYKSQLKGLYREPIEEHFAEHAEEEAQHIETLQRFIVGMGAVPTTERRSIPSLDKINVRDIINLQLKFEIEAVEMYKTILSKLDKNSEPLKIEIEDILAQETEHMHDLQLLLRD
jgi:bacterioferritin